MRSLQFWGLRREIIIQIDKNKVKEYKVLKETILFKYLFYFAARKDHTEHITII